MVISFAAVVISLENMLFDTNLTLLKGTRRIEVNKTTRNSTGKCKQT